VSTATSGEEQKTDPPRASDGNIVHNNLSNATEREYPTVSDDDLTMVEISDMRIAEELMCLRHLRPPLPVKLPPGLISLPPFPLLLF
jgi:hypothetical protein